MDWKLREVSTSKVGLSFDMVHLVCYESTIMESVHGLKPRTIRYSFQTDLVTDWINLSQMKPIWVIRDLE
jgi:hypothetical protein